MRVSILSFLLLICCGALTGQPDNTLSTFSFLHQFDNPAAMGLDGSNHLYLGTYQKWLKLDDSPRTYWLASSHPIINRSFGIGGTLVYDQAGLLTTTKIGLNGSVHLNPDSDHIFSIGATARYANFGFSPGNVNDPFLSDEPAAGLVSFGGALNYHFAMQDDQFFNLQIYMPNLPGSLDISSDSRDNPLTYTLPQALILQANLNYSLSETSYLTPSLRYQGQLGDATGPNKQIADLALGITFLDGALSTRIGYRTVDAGIIYGGVGYRFGQNISTHAFYEPGGPLGSSAAFVADLEFGEMSLPEPDSDEGEDEQNIGRKASKADCYKSENCIQETLLENINPPSFNIVRQEDPNLKSTYLTISFRESDDGAQNYFNQADFLRQIPLDHLLENLNAFAKEDLAKNNLRITNVTLRTSVRDDLNAQVFDNFNGQTINVKYLTEDSRERVAQIPKGKDINQLELALIKLHYLQTEIQKQSSGGPIYFRKEIVSTAQQVDARSVDIIITIR